MKHSTSFPSFAKIVLSISFVILILGLSSYYIRGQNSLLTQIAGTGTIQGITVKYGDGSVTVPTTITINGVGTRTTTASNNSYSFSGLTSGIVYSISVTVPAGWTNPRFNYCLNAVGTCHNTATVYSGTSLGLNVPAGGYYDLWWFFDPIVNLLPLTFESSLSTPVPAFARYCANATTFLRTTSGPKAGNFAFKFSGTDDCSTANSFVYYKIADANIPVTENTVLEYKIAPQSTLGRNVGVDLLLDNGQYLRDQDIYSDDAVLMHPAYQSNHTSFSPCCPVTSLTTIKVNLGKIRGRAIKQIIVAYDDASPSQVGTFDARIDDIKIYDVAPFRTFALGQAVVSIASQYITKDLSTGVLASAIEQQSFEQGTVIDGPISTSYLKDAAGVNIPKSNMLWRIDFTSNLLAGSSDTSAIDGWIRENYLQSNTPAQVSSAIFASTNTCNKIIKGDVDCSGDVTVTDGVVTLKCAAGMAPCDNPSTLDIDILQKEDMDCNGKITVADGVNVLRKAAWLSVAECAPKKWKDIIDFNGDSKSDILTFGNGSWHIATSLQNAVSGIYDIERPGVTGDNFFPTDYDYDGRADMASLNRTTSRIGVKFSKENWNTDYLIGGTYSLNEYETRVLGDYDGNGFTDFVAWNRYSGNWRGLPGGDKVFGDKGTIPVPGDYDGDGKTDLAVWRPSTGSWDVLQSSDGVVVSKQIGDQGTYPAQADYDGDGKTDRAVYRSNGSFMVLQSTNGAMTGYTYSAGQGGDLPLTGDYDGDGKADYASFGGPTTYDRNFYIHIRKSTDGSVVSFATPHYIYRRDWVYPDSVVPPITYPCSLTKGTWQALYNGAKTECFPVSQTGDLLLKETYSQIKYKMGRSDGTMLYTTKANFASANPTLTITHGNVTTKILIDGNVVSTRANDIYVGETYSVTLSVTPGEHTLQINSTIDGESGLNGNDYGIEVHGPSIWGSGTVVTPTPPPGGGGKPTKWGGSGIGASPVLGAVMVETWTNASEIYMPRYPIVYVDGKPIQQTNDLSILQSLSSGRHTLSVERMPGIDIWMSQPCTGCFNHPLNNFAMTDSIGFDYDGSNFMHFAIQYFPTGRSLQMTWFANTTDGKIIQGSTLSTSESGILFQNFWQVIHNLFTIPRQYITAIIQRYFAPSKASAYIFLGKWQGCNIPGHVIVPNVQLSFGTGDPTIQKQISNAVDEWRKAAGYMINSPVSTDKDYGRGVLDHNGVIAYIDDNYVIPALESNLADVEAKNSNRIGGITILWDETGVLLNTSTRSPDIIQESDILINTSSITDSLSIAAWGYYGYFQNVFMHEYGHHVGLGHSGLSDLMKSNISRDYILTVGPDDVSGVHNLYQGCF